MKKFLMRPAPKVIILAFAGLFWVIAGFNVVRIGTECMTAAHGWHNLVALGLSLVTFLLFFFLIFFRMYRKNSDRIISNQNPAPIWSAYELRGYLVVIFMIALGITFRSVLKGYPLVIGTFYIGLGVALFVGGLCFLFRIFTYNPEKSAVEA